ADEQPDRRDERLPDPHVREGKPVVVPRDLAPRTGEGADEDAAENQTEDGIGEDAGGDRQPVGAVAPELSAGELPVSTHKRRTLDARRMRVNGFRVSPFPPGVSRL